MEQATHDWNEEQSTKLKLFLRRSPTYRAITVPESKSAAEIMFLNRTFDLFMFFICCEGKLGKLKPDEVTAIDAYHRSVAGLPAWYTIQVGILQGETVATYLQDIGNIVWSYRDNSHGERRAPLSTGMKNMLGEVLYTLCQVFGLTFTGTKHSDAVKLIELLCEYADLAYSPSTAKHLIDAYKKQAAIVN